MDTLPLQEFLVGGACIGLILVFIILACTKKISKLRTELKETKKLVDVDSLTGLLSWYGLDGAVKHMFGAFAHKHFSKIILAYIDLDNFKTINDDYGHGTGDKVIVAYAEALRESFRGEDVLGRHYCGDEFIVLLPETSETDARIAFDRAGKIYNDSLKKLGLENEYSMSIGYASTKEFETFEIMLEKAEERMRTFKKAKGAAR